MQILFENGQSALLEGNRLTLGNYVHTLEDNSTPIPGARFWYRLPGGSMRYMPHKIKEVRK